MWLVHLALKRPLTILVLAFAILSGAALSLRRAPADIFPSLGVPVVYVVQPYGGMSPTQMEGQLVGYYEYHFLYINGIEHIESQSIQGMAMLKLYFHPGTDIAQSLAQVTAMAFRATSFMPPGTIPPFIVRFDVGSVPVGQLVFSSDTRSGAEVQDLALFKVGRSSRRSRASRPRRRPAARSACSSRTSIPIGCARTTCRPTRSRRRSPAATSRCPPETCATAT